MRIGYLIGALGSGGSERQLSELAVGMAARGHQVEVACYDGAGVYDAYVEQRGVALRRSVAGNKRRKIRYARSWLRDFRPDIAHGFMKRASSLAVLANLPRRRCRVIASDMSTASYSPWRPILWPSLVLFGLADCVVTQTEMNRRSLGRLAPWLRTKTRIVRNGVDTDRFLPQPTRGRGAPFRFVCVGTVYRVKNPVRIVEAAGILRARGFSFTLDWVGKTGQGAMESPEYHQARDAVAAHGLQGTVRFLGRSDQMEEVYGRYDALVHVSLQEGIPNAVVEAMACGLPLVVGRVSDLPLIVEEADNGFVCGERDVSSIADAMQHMLEAGDHGREAMGARSRELAVRWFGRGRFLDEYEELYDRLCRPVRTAARPDWRSRS